MLNTVNSILKLFVFVQSTHCKGLHRLMRGPDEKEWKYSKFLRIVQYSTVVHFTDENWILKTLYCIGCVVVCKIGFTNWNAKITLLRASMVITYYIKLFRTGAGRHNGILMSLLLLVAKTRNIAGLVIPRLVLHLKVQGCVFFWFPEYLTHL